MLSHVECRQISSLIFEERESVVDIETRFEFDIEIAEVKIKLTFREIRCVEWR